MQNKQGKIALMKSNLKIEQQNDPNVTFKPALNPVKNLIFYISYEAIWQNNQEEGSLKVIGGHLQEILGVAIEKAGEAWVVEREITGSWGVEI